MLHAHIQASCLAEHTVIELFLVLFCVLRCIPNTHPVLFFGIAAPHCIYRLFACQKVIRVLKKHACVANINSNLIVLALAMAIAQQSDFGCIWYNAFDLNSHFVFGSLLLSVTQGIIDHFVVKSSWLVMCTACSQSELRRSHNKIINDF